MLLGMWWRTHQCTIMQLAWVSTSAQYSWRVGAAQALAECELARWLAYRAMLYIASLQAVVSFPASIASWWMLCCSHVQVLMQIAKHVSLSPMCLLLNWKTH